MSHCSALFLPLLLILQILQGKTILELEETSIFSLTGLLLQSRQNNPKKSYTQKKAKHEPSGWAILTRCLFIWWRRKFQKDIPIIIHNASYDAHFIINQIAEEFKVELNCIGENMEKYITFYVPFMKKKNKKNSMMVKQSHIN